MGGSQAQRTTMERPATYSNCTAWDTYRMQFEMLARVHKWNEEKKATFLAMSLRGLA